MKYNKQGIMSNAWAMVKTFGLTMSVALKRAWAWAKAHLDGKGNEARAMSEDLIKTFESCGFKRWTKGDMDRLYINAEALGLKYDCYKSGNICSSSFRGESISHRKALDMIGSKIWVDVKTSKMWSRDANEVLLDAVRALVRACKAACC